jgi:hypothetical protein
LQQRIVVSQAMRSIRIKRPIDSAAQTIVTGSAASIHAVC